MKIRNDFVTNSSSSSFIVAVKDVAKLPEFATLPTWASKMIKTYMKLITRDGDAVHNEKELRRYFIDQYGEDEIKEDGWCKEHYDDALKAINKGYSVLMIQMDYNDETGSEFLQSLPTKDTGGGVYLISSDN